VSYVPKETKEIDKMSAVREESQIIGCFLDWLRQDGVVLCRIDKELAKEGFLKLYEIGETTEELLAKYFDIDMYRLEHEQREVLKKIRSNVSG